MSTSSLGTSPPPERAAIVSQDGTVTFGEMHRYVRWLTAWIAAQGIRPGQAVGVAIADEPLHLLTSLALLRMGCPQISLATHDPAPLRQDLIRRCGVVAVIGEAPRDDGVRHIPISGALPLGDAADGAADLPVPRDDAIALYLATSGTTGASKIIACTHRQLAQQGATRHMPPAARSEYIPSSIQFLYPKKHRLRSAMNGYTGVFHLAGPAEIPGICRAHGVDVLRLSPPQARSLIDLAAARPDCRLPEGLHVYVGGARISGAMRADFQRRQVHSLYVEYGATECGNIAVAGPELHAGHPDTVGRPVTGVTVEVVDAAGSALPAGAAGAIRIRTPGMAAGYLDDPALTENAFRDGWYYSNDRGHMTEDGLLVFEGRADDMMILNSINIYPAEIERVAETFPGVIECAAFPLPSTAHGEIPMLAAVTVDSCDLTALAAHCRQQLGVRAPRKIFRTPDLPRNDAGKVLRQALSARAAEGRL